MSIKLTLLKSGEQLVSEMIDADKIEAEKESHLTKKGFSINKSIESF